MSSNKKRRLKESLSDEAKEIILDECDLHLKVGGSEIYLLDDIKFILDDKNISYNDSEVEEYMNKCLSGEIKKPVAAAIIEPDFDSKFATDDISKVDPKYTMNVEDAINYLNKFDEEDIVVFKQNNKIAPVTGSTFKHRDNIYSKNEDLNLATGSDDSDGEIAAMRAEQKEKEAAQAARKERYALYHKLFDEYEQSNPDDPGLDRIHSWIRDAVEFKLLDKISDLPQEIDGQKIKYRFSMSDKNIYTDPYKEYIFVVLDKGLRESFDLEDERDILMKAHQYKCKLRKSDIEEALEPKDLIEDMEYIYNKLCDKYDDVNIRYWRFVEDGIVVRKSDGQVVRIEDDDFDKFYSKSISESNELEKRAKHHRKHQKGMSPFYSLAESLEIYNGTNVPDFDYTQINLDDSREIGLHCGTEQACRDKGYKYINKLNISNENILALDTDMTGYWSDPAILKYLTNVFSDSEISALRKKMRAFSGEETGTKYKNYSKIIRDALLDKGYNVISYPNSVEDARSTSYIILDSSIINKLTNLSEQVDNSNYSLTLDVVTFTDSVLDTFNSLEFEQARIQVSKKFPNLIINRSGEHVVLKGTYDDLLAFLRQYRFENWESRIELLEESKKKNKKKPYSSINTNAGNVEHNINMFNTMTNATESPSTNPTGPMAEAMKKSANEYTITYHKNTACRDRRPETIDDVEDDWTVAPIRADSDLEALQRAVAIIKDYDIEDIIDDGFDSEESCISYLDEADWGDGSPIIIKVESSDKVLYDTGYDKQSWIDEYVEDDLNESRDPYFKPYGYRDAAKVLNGKAPQYYYHLKEIEMDEGDGVKLANYARKIGLPVVQDPDDDPDYPTFYILGKYHWNDYFYPYPSDWEPKVEKSLTEANKKETIEIYYPNLKFTQTGHQRDVDDWDEWDVNIEYFYEVDKDDLYTYIFESCIDENDFPEGFEDNFDPNNNEDWSRFVKWLDDNFDSIYEKYEKKIQDNYEESAIEEASENYDADDYIDWDSMPGGHDDLDESLNCRKSIREESISTAKLITREQKEALRDLSIILKENKINIVLPLELDERNYLKVNLKNNSINIFIKPDGELNVDEEDLYLADEYDEERLLDILSEGNLHESFDSDDELYRVYINGQRYDADYTYSYLKDTARELAKDNPDAHIEIYDSNDLVIFEIYKGQEYDHAFRSFRESLNETLSVSDMFKETSLKVIDTLEGAGKRPAADLPNRSWDSTRSFIQTGGYDLDKASVGEVLLNMLYELDYRNDSKIRQLADYYEHILERYVRVAAGID